MSALEAGGWRKAVSVTQKHGMVAEGRGGEQ